MKELQSIEFTLRMTRVSPTQYLLHSSVKGDAEPSRATLVSMFRHFFADAENPDSLKDVIVQVCIEHLLKSDNNSQALAFANRIHEIMSNHFDLCQEFVNEVKDNNAK